MERERHQGSRVPLRLLDYSSLLWLITSNEIPKTKNPVDMAGPTKKRAAFGGTKMRGTRSESSSASGSSVPTSNLSSVLALSSRALSTSSSAATSAGSSVPISKLQLGSSPSKVEATPISKTALCRLTYYLEKLPEFYVFEVETCSDISKTPPKLAEEQLYWKEGDTNNWKHVLPRQIRYQALTELLSTERFATIRDSITVKIGVNQYVDHLIVRVPNNENQKKELKAIMDAEAGIDVSLCRTIKTTYQGAEKEYSQKIRCFLSAGRKCNQDRLPDLFWKSLDAVIRKRATPNDTDAKYGIASEFLNDLAGITDKKIELSALPWIKVDQPDDIQVKLRKQLSLDSSQSLLHMDFDLAVSFPRWNLQAALNYIMHDTNTEEEITTCFPIMARFLKGLRVRCAYKPLTKTQIKNGQKTTRLNYRQPMTEDDLKLNEHVFQIKDVKLPCDAPKFKYEGEEISVFEYFDKILDFPLTHPELPLPLVSDTKNNWFLISLLALDDPHVYTKLPHLLPSIKNVGQDVLTKGLEWIKGEFGNGFFEGLAGRRGNEEGDLVKAGVGEFGVEFVSLGGVGRAFL
ncbi:hypothetical protein T440DRAFT_530525 [Plenodomus tracheiphilus IPT5]|uniref:Uncharacterized protein n=1 Tax=Plenodomus tracheiphilus IPT5 TaxID=1408161 RepID=A0A6A7B4L5_9PLEO|nr:hypothetical protein T440DRAFT_530525 [Plenodomus tracheiphilus IPT5]